MVEPVGVGRGAVAGPARAAGGGAGGARRRSSMRCARRAGSGGWSPAPGDPLWPSRRGRRWSPTARASPATGSSACTTRRCAWRWSAPSTSPRRWCRWRGSPATTSRSIDPREAFASAARFPDTALSHDWPDAALAEFGLDARTAVVTLTHDPKLDDPAIAAALRAPVFYLGCLGSSRTHAKRVERLQAAGFGDGGDRAHPRADRRRHRRAVAGGDRGGDPRRGHRAAAPARDPAP